MLLFTIELENLDYKTATMEGEGIFPLKQIDSFR